MDFLKKVRGGAYLTEPRKINRKDADREKGCFRSSSPLVILSDLLRLLAVGMADVRQQAAMLFAITGGVIAIDLVWTFLEKKIQNRI